MSTVFKISNLFSLSSLLLAPSQFFYLSCANDRYNDALAVEASRQTLQNSFWATPPGAESFHLSGKEDRVLANERTGVSTSRSPNDRDSTWLYSAKIEFPLRSPKLKIEEGLARASSSSQPFQLTSFTNNRFNNS
jgi:hypothetical protein